MLKSLFATESRPSGLRILPRDYQIEGVDGCYKIWDGGVLGALIRAFTGGGKTIMACMAADRWLARSPDHRVLILSYEIQLVDQFAQEIEDVLGIRPGKEQGQSNKYHGEQICVACRPTLLPRTLVTDEQKSCLSGYGLADVGLLTKQLADKLLRELRGEKIGLGDARDLIGEHNCHWTVNQRGVVSRVHQFDPTLNWLIVADEAHKFTYKHKSIRHLYDWFATNEKTRWLGITATPKRADGVSIGHKLFPGIALDFPLYSPIGRCAVKEGFAVPYKQKYICVEGVDFKTLAKAKDGDFDENELQRILGTEEQLARLIEPMLDLCGERKTLVFNVTVQMAKDVATYINARAKCKCDCGKVKWYPSMLIGDGAQCPQCDGMIEIPHIVLSGDQCQVVWEHISATRRKEIYKDHQKGRFQFLSVCGLCIARGTLVMTDHGEIPIEQVTLDMKLWDGVEFVSHAGVISKGRKEVIRYAGLTATGDHNVWTENGWERLAACKQQRIAIRVSAVSGTPVRESCGYYRNDHSAWQEPPCGTGSAMQWMRKSLCQVLQRIEAGSRRLQAMCKTLRRSAVVANAMQRCEETLLKSTRQVLSRLWREGHQVPVSIASSDGSVDYGTLGTSQGIESRPQRERRSLRTRKHSLVESGGTGEQQAETAEVFDILNAGQRHRFTANGLIVSNCKEGYNDPDIACVTVFRPVSKAASSLAEQMKGRSSRPLRGLIEGMATAGERIEAIANSAKPDALIIDLVGITGLADCASTVMIYSEGLPDEVREQAEQLLLDDDNDIDNVEDAIKEAVRLSEEEKERIREERLAQERRAKEEAERRARAGAEVTYSTHDVGAGSNTDPNRASDKQIRGIWWRGIELTNWEPTKKQAHRIIGQLEANNPADEVAYSNGIPNECWKEVKAALWFRRKLKAAGFQGDTSTWTHRQVQKELMKRENPLAMYSEQITKAADGENLTHVAAEIYRLHLYKKMSDDVYTKLIASGKQKREELNRSEEF